MSGGYIKEQGMVEGEHQLVVFAFKGPISAPKCKEWNQEINALKQMFGEQVIGVTVTGEDTPDIFRRPRGGGRGMKRPTKKAVKKAVKKGRRRGRGGR